MDYSNIQNITQHILNTQKCIIYLLIDFRVPCDEN